MKKAMFGAGCFWGVQAEFDKLHGVLKTSVGYSGGRTDHPNYEGVCRGDTGHAEVVYLEFDESKISFSELLENFWSLHNPTTLNRQGPDIGTQYRSAIYYFDEDQKNQALKSRALAQKSLDNPIVTEITAAEKFWPAEEYHQKYFVKKGISSCPI